MADSKITQEEMVELFGEAMPVEAFNLLADAPEDWTLAQVRERLREIAAERDDVKLKPCPFCGAAPEFETPRASNWKTYSIKCSNPRCNVKPHACDLTEIAIAAWNTRVPEVKHIGEER